MIREYFAIFIVSSVLLTTWNLLHNTPDPNWHHSPPWWKNTSVHLLPNITQWFFNFSHEDYFHELIFFQSVLN